MNRVIKLFNFILLIIAIVISYFIFSKKEIRFNALKSLFETMTNYLNIGKQEKMVSTFSKFICVGEDCYTNDSFSIYSPKKGTVISADENSIVIKCEDNYFAYFDNLINVNVKKLDVVSSEYSLANFIDYFNFYFIYDNNKYTYEEIMENN